MSKRIAILGSTGSIGCSALDVIAHLGEPFKAIALSAHSQTDKLIQQIKQHRPAAVAVTDEKNCHAVVNVIEECGAKLLRGPRALEEIVRRDDVDLVLAAIVGAAGLPAVLAAVESGKPVALANKESLVVAGSILMPMAREKNVSILPVDSEHSAIFQAMQSGRRNEVRRVILTASGGPFRNTPMEQMRRATLQDALAHPTWRMGSKITIDSATMFNKALELIEACWLFDLEPEQIEIVIHPESIIHSMVEFCDGSTIAQLSPPDMKTPIQYAFTYPERREGCSKRMDWTKSHTLHFQSPDLQRFPAIRMAYDVARRKGSAGAILNAANECAVNAFMRGEIAFGEISEVVERTIAGSEVISGASLDDLLQADRAARRTADNLIKELSPSLD